MYYVYILQLADKSFYIGYSSDLKQRIAAHKNNQVSSTKGKQSVVLVWYAAFRSQTKATAFEKYLKSSSGFAFRNKHLL